ncbi:hypothetical protein CTKZ_24020 [Cellulomonas algicola]|uniref:GtrA/DPMS transmembrane domain-containing protein n=1 Tax=Cellulomonas algicola TaxID=2071633 RepID=A0A401V1P7_9CELL|nr:hypothetical protein CTKZ_24020 [Cellulomonas algicola]
MRRLVATHATLLRFIVVGGGAALLELGTFELLARAGLPVVAANVLSFVLGLLTSFAGYRLWTFAGEHTTPVTAQLGAYVALALVNVAATSAIISVLVSAGLVPWVAKAICMALVATWNFLLLNRIVFRRASPSPTRTTH